MLNVIMLNVVMLNVVAPFLDCPIFVGSLPDWISPLYFTFLVGSGLTYKCLTKLKKLPGTNTLAYLSGVFVTNNILNSLYITELTLGKNKLECLFNICRQLKPT
jgi:hypothetical protein